MSRLIDADKLIKKLNEKALAQHDIPLVEHDFRELIHNAPTVDVVEVVRCEDCKFFVYDEEYERWYCKTLLRYPKDNYYCSYGEEKDNTVVRE